MVRVISSEWLSPDIRSPIFSLVQYSLYPRGTTMDAGCIIVPINHKSERASKAERKHRRKQKRSRSWQNEQNPGNTLMQVSPPRFQSVSVNKVDIVDKSSKSHNSERPADFQNAVAGVKTVNAPLLYFTLLYFTLSFILWSLFYILQ